MDSEKTCATCAHYAGLAKECRAKAPIAALVQGPQGQPAAMGFLPADQAGKLVRRVARRSRILPAALNAKSNLGAH